MDTAGKVIKCKAAVAWEYGKPLVTEEIEVAPPEADEVRIKIVATAVCHTDLYHLFEGMETELFPTILGHEAAGIVESVGSGVTEFHPGDKVIPLFINQCRECRFCKSPKTNLCDKGENGGHDELAFEKSRVTCKGKKLMPFMGIGSFSEYILMNQTAVAKIDPAAPLDKVCLIGCAISTGFGAAVNTAKVEAGSTCAVFGLGAVGLAAVMGCKFAGAERIIAVDTNPKKAEKAKVFGATDFVNPKDQKKPISEVLAEMTNGGVDYSIECVGNVEVMVIKCKAAVAWEPNKPVVIEEIEVAPPQENEVRIKIVATSVCHSDLYHLFEYMHPEGFPTVLGHEAAGIVESVGPGVTEFQPGDKVIPVFLGQCRECRFCKSPKTNQCELAWTRVSDVILASVESRFTCKGKKVLQFMGTSTFSEYTVVHQSAVTKIDPAAPLEKVCILGCGLCTGYGAAVNVAKVEPGSTCAVFGLGAVGLAAVMGCKDAGATRIIAVDINSEKAEKAKVFGATEFVNPKDHNKPINQVLVEMTNGGVDYSLECVGKVEVMRSALESCIKAWGISVIVGWTDVYNVTVKPLSLLCGRTWKGCMFGGFKSKDGVAQMVKAYLEKKLMVDEFITHNMTLDQINDAIGLMKDCKCIRTVITLSPQ